jgi:exodeoxyribonuclease-3
MKIATFNINSIRHRLPALLAWLAEAQPDVACLQELRILPTEFPEAALADAGYGAIWKGQRTRWNGVAILARGAAPIEVRRVLPGAPAADEARYIEAAVNGVLVGCLYAPNGNPQPGPKFAHKLAWLDCFNAHAATLLAAGVPVVLAGDYNIVPTDVDIYATRSYADNALLQPQARAAFATLTAQGWVDALRTLHPQARIYTFWDYLRKRWERDAGLRIDHLLLDPALAARLTGAGVDRAVRGMPGASDHAPAWLTLKDKPTRRRKG